MITHWDFPSADPWTNFPPPISTLWFPRPILLSFPFLHPFSCLLVQKSPEPWNQVKIVKAVIIVLKSQRFAMKHLDWLHLIASVVASVFVHPRLWRQFLESGLMPFKIFKSTDSTEGDNNWSNNVLPWLFSPHSQQNCAALRKKPSLGTWDLGKKYIV